MSTSLQPPRENERPERSRRKGDCLPFPIYATLVPVLFVFHQERMIGSGRASGR